MLNAKVTQKASDALLADHESDETRPHVVAVRGRSGYSFGAEGPNQKFMSASAEDDLVFMLKAEGDEIAQPALNSLRPIPPPPESREQNKPGVFSDKVKCERESNISRQQKFVVCPFDPPADVRILDEDMMGERSEGTHSGGAGKIRELTSDKMVLRLSTKTRETLFSDASLRAHVNQNADQEGIEDDYKRFVERCVPHAKDWKLALASLTPEDVTRRWFQTFAPLIGGTSGKVDWWKLDNAIAMKVLGHKLHVGTHGKVKVSGLTLTMLCQRQKNSVPGALEVFAYNPMHIAGEIRKNDLGELLGRRFINAFLHSILHTLKDRSVRAKSEKELLRASADLITSLMARQKYGHESLDGKNESTSTKVNHIYSFLGDMPVNQAGKEPYLLLSIKTGIAYGALINYSRTLLKDRQRIAARNKVLIDGLAGGLNIASQSLPMLPPVLGKLTSSAATTGASLAKLAIDEHVEDSEVAANVKHAIDAFNSYVIGNANENVILEVKGNSPHAKQYAKTATRVLQQVVDEEVKFAPFSE